MEIKSSPIEAHQAVRALGALAQDHRLAAFRLLVQAGPGGLAAGVLADRIGLPASSMSFHLAQLAHAGLVIQRRQGRSIIYSADFAAMNGLLAYLMDNCCGGPACLPETFCLPEAFCQSESATPTAAGAHR